MAAGEQTREHILDQPVMANDDFGDFLVNSVKRRDKRPGRLLEIRLRHKENAPVAANKTRFWEIIPAADSGSAARPP